MSVVDADRFLSILMDESGSLLRLAGKSGVPLPLFFKGADLKGLDLSNQDLRGLNFDGADLRGTKLDRVKYTSGAFNGAVLEDAYKGLADDFEFYIDDFVSGNLKNFYFYGAFRDLFLDDAIRASGYSFQDFAKMCSISPGTLRRARRANLVSSFTMRHICKELSALAEAEVSRGIVDRLYSQPVAAIASFNTREGKRTFIRRKTFSELFGEVLGLFEGGYPSDSFMIYLRTDLTSVD